MIDAVQKIDVSLWPDVPPAERPKPFPHAGGYSAPDLTVLRSKGWEPIDVRLESGPTLIRHLLDGAMLGIIDLDARQLRTLELAAKAYQLKDAGADAEDKTKLVKEDTLDAMLGKLNKTLPQISKHSTMPRVAKKEVAE